MAERIKKTWGITMIAALVIILAYLIMRIVISVNGYAYNTGWFLSRVYDVATANYDDVNWTDVDAIAIPIIGGVDLGLSIAGAVFVFIPLVFGIVYLLTGKTGPIGFGFLVFFLVLNLCLIVFRFFEMGMPFHEMYIQRYPENLVDFNPFFLVAAFLGFAGAVTYIVAYAMSKKDAKKVTVNLEK